MRGTITQLAESRWKVQVERRPLAGTRRFYARRVSGTYADADLVRAQLVARVQAELDEQPVAGTVGAWLREWVESAQHLDRWQPSTTRRHLEDIARCAPITGIALDQLRPIDVDRLYVGLARRYAPSVVRGVHATLRGALRDAARLGLIDRLPTTGARLPAMARVEQQAPTTAQVQTMLAAAAHDPMWSAWLHLAAATGARPSEVCGLRWGDIADTTVTIRGAARADHVDRRTVAVSAGTKTRGARAVSIDPATVEALAAWRRTRVQLHLRVGAALGPGTLVFPASRRPDTARPLGPDAASDRWRRLWRVHGDGRPVPLYGLRHWHASSLLRAGVPVPEVARRLGHASAKMTLDVYGHHITDSSDLAAATVAALMQGASG